MDSGTRMGFEEAGFLASKRGGRLATPYELKYNLLKNGKNKNAILKGDNWVAVLTTGGVKDFMQIGDRKGHFPGKRHNRHYGFPKWGNMAPKK